ncbi:MAG: hypothetical protein JSW52_05435 [Candidatus Coatesbacteria bacterium]|nr:MAG: hypothetical protein JSW52_05435 [Candidatus Coatesbacteria bacterium]
MYIKNRAKILVIFLSLSATPAFAASLSVTIYGAGAVPLGGLGSSEAGHFDFLIEDNPYGPHDFVDIMGFTLNGTNAGISPGIGGKVGFGVEPWLDIETGFTYHFARSGGAPASEDVKEIRTGIGVFSLGANFKRGFGSVGAYFGGGAGCYFQTLELYASGTGRSGFVYSDVYTLDKTMGVSSLGLYFGGGLEIPLSGRTFLDVGSRAHWVLNGGDYSIEIHEEYGYDPYYSHEYVFDTPVHKTYNDFFVEVLVGFGWGVI